jgi:hypothetical protein
MVIGVGLRERRKKRASCKTGVVRMVWCQVGDTRGAFRRRSWGGRWMRIRATSSGVERAARVGFRAILTCQVRV